MAFDKQKFLVRTGSAAIFVIVLLGSIFLNYYSFSLLFLIISVWGLLEFYSLMEKLNTRPDKALGILTGTTLYLWAMASNSEMIAFTGLDLKASGILALVMIFAFLIFIRQLFRNDPAPFQNIAITLGGVFYVSLPFALLNISSYVFSTLPDPYTEIPYFTYTYSSSLIFGIFLLIWSNDTFAYLSGSFLGKHKMYERISPGKTWEGTLGGAVLTLVASFFISRWFSVLDLSDWMIIAAIVTVIGTLGDLIESMLKRSAGVKDSGSIMPGHGGILDRFDSLILATPFIFTYLYLTR
ncbi:MAG: phosphatidate cytidylyltransferase [Bacteroidia bacterium]